MTNKELKLKISLIKAKLDESVSALTSKNLLISNKGYQQVHTMLNKIRDAKPTKKRGTVMKKLTIIALFLAGFSARADFNNYQGRYSNVSGAFANAYVQQYNQQPQNVYVSPYSQGGVQMNSGNCRVIVVPNGYGSYTAQTKCY